MGGEQVSIDETISIESFQLGKMEDLPIGKVTLSGESNEFVVLGGKKYYTHELMRAFGGTLNPGLSPYKDPQYGNPTPLGLSGFALTTFVTSLVNAQVMGITVPNIVFGMACFYGGFVQFFAGIWELYTGNTFAGTAFTLYGAFWLSFAAIRIEAFGIASAYDDEKMLANAVGFYLVGWAIFTLMFVLATLKSTVALFLLFFSLFVTFILLAAGEFSGMVGITRAAGVTGVITAFVAWYNAFAGTATEQNSYITAKSIPLPKFKLN